jgi:hypothetical protein
MPMMSGMPHMAGMPHQMAQMAGMHPMFNMPGLPSSYPNPTPSTTSPPPHSLPEGQFQMPFGFYPYGYFQQPPMSGYPPNFPQGQVPNSANSSDKS